MKNFQKSFPMPLQPVPKLILFLFIIVALLGFFDAAYLTVNHYLGAPLPCSIISGCENVTTSRYATVGGIPIALFGAAYYFLIFCLGIIYLDTRKDRIIGIAARITPFGFVISLILVYTQLFVIGAICVYCVFSAIASTALFILGLYIIKKFKSQNLNLKI